jgi:membrane associated rhomboid family serine protease
MRRGAPPLVWLLAGLFVGVELLLYASDTGLIARGWRSVAYDRFAFFAIVIRAIASGQSLPLESYFRFVSHAFLHGGFLHLLMNTAIFLALGAHLARAVGQGATLLLFFASVVAGAVGFGLLTSEAQQFIPMVGASGGIFGMLGAMKRWEWQHINRHSLPKRRFWTTVIVFVAINLVLSLSAGMTGGGVAWEAHLGGFIAGWLVAGALTPRPGTSVGPI